MLGDTLKYQDLEWCDGDIHLPGIRGIVRAIAKRDILKWPTLPKTALTDMGVLATYSGDFILAAGAVWKNVGVIVDKSPVESKSQGVRPSKSFLNTATLLHPGTGEAATGFARQANNDDMVYIVQQKDGKFRVLGNEMYQTDTTFDQKLGGAATDEMGTTFTVSVTDVCPAPFYIGEIVTADGIINAAA